MTKSVKVLGMGVVQVILAAFLLILMLGFAAQGIMEEITTNQQLSHFYKFRNQVASICDMVKVNRGTPFVSNKEYLVLYPFYDIRFYNQTGSAPEPVRNLCKGDECACLVKVGKVGYTTEFLCMFSDISCVYNSVPIEAVLSCFNMQQLGCNNHLWFAKGKEEPIRDYSKEYGVTCKLEGVVTWDRTGFFYDKLSELCEEVG